PQLPKPATPTPYTPRPRACRSRPLPDDAHAKATPELAERSDPGFRPWGNVMGKSHQRVPSVLYALLATGFSVVTHAQTPPPLKEAYVDVPDARLWFTDTGGRGVPVIFLHANTGSSRVWAHQRSAFVARGFRVIAYDRRGFGRSVVTPGAPP